MKLLTLFSACAPEVAALQDVIDKPTFVEKVLRGCRMDMNLFSIETELNLVDALKPGQTDRENLLGFIPCSIRLTILMKNKNNANQVLRHNYDLASYDQDFSNCGVARVHKINSLGIKGMGTVILSLLETYFCSIYRRYIVCSLNSLQIQRGAEIFLKKHGYEVLSEFKGANSGNMCKLLAKNITETNRIKPWKPKNEPTGS